MVGTAFRVECLLPVNASEYVVERDSLAFRAMIMKDLNLSKMEFLDCKPHGSSGAYIARLATRPDFGGYVPKAWVDWVVGDQLEFVDELQYDPALMGGPGQYKLLVKCVPPWLGQRADIRCTLSFEHVSERECRQVLEGSVAIKVIWLGRIAEPLVVRGLQQAYRDLPAAVQRWAEFREQLIAEGRAEELLAGRPAIPFPQYPASAAAGSMTGQDSPPGSPAASAPAMSAASDGPHGSAGRLAAGQQGRCTHVRQDSGGHAAEEGCTAKWGGCSAGVAA